MAVFLIEIIAILVFWRFADKSRLRELLPVVLAGVFLRFLEHFILIDWLHIWLIPGSPWRTLWIPITADITVWPIAVTLFIQYLPIRLRVLYFAFWCLLMSGFMKILMWANVFTMERGWTMYYSFVLLFGYFGSIYLIWRWLRQKPGGAT